MLAAIVGSAGLESTWAALEAKKTVALANKETLVMAGELIAELARKSGGQLLPVDSEHSAMFQALQAGQPSEVARLILTASGGPFKHLSPAELQHVTVAEALAHPTWTMGPKITIDSATMMNKALEIIEARWLFGIDGGADLGGHPSAVDRPLAGRVRRRLGDRPAEPARHAAADSVRPRLSRTARPAWRGGSIGGSRCRLEFEPPDRERFPALALGEECARSGGTTGAVLNAANEAAVAAFLDGELHFTEIVPACRSVLSAHHFEPNPTLERLLKLDRWARQEISRWVCA